MTTLRLAAAAALSVAGLTATAGELTPQQAVRRKKVMLERLRTHMPALTHPRGDRWPIMTWATMDEGQDMWQAWIDRGISPCFNACSSVAGARQVLPALEYFRSRGVPIILLPQGVVQRAFRTPPIGTGCDHLPPARPAQSTKDVPTGRHDFACPAWMYENPALTKHAEQVRRMCAFLKEQGIRPVSMWLDFESGAYLRNGAEKEPRVRRALAEARKCARCVKRFGRRALASPRAYSDAIDKARAYAMRTGFVEPVHSVFPGCHTGNFFVHPIRREPPVPGLFHAYGWNGSGFDVAQPRCYFIPGWGGGARNSQRLQDWNIFYYCVEHFSSCARVLENMILPLGK